MNNTVLINILENWYVIFGIIVLLVSTCVITVRNMSISKIREWLKYAVSVAEKELGTGTGQLKLRQVYDAFVEKYRWLSIIISFKKFSNLVDEALVWMRTEMDGNQNIKKYIIDQDIINHTIQTVTSGIGSHVE